MDAKMYLSMAKRRIRDAQAEVERIHEDPNPSPYRASGLKEAATDLEEAARMVRMAADELKAVSP